MTDDKKKNRMLAACMVIAGVVLFLLSGSSPELVRDTEFSRNEPGGGHEDYEFDAVLEGIRVEGIDVRVDARDYTVDECKELFDRCRDVLIKTILDTNEDLGMVTSDLKFVAELKGYPFSFEYDTDSPDKIGSEGEILTEKSFSAKVRITGKYEDFSDSFTVRVQVAPGEEVKKRVYKRKITSILGDSGQNPEKVELPKEIDGVIISYETSGKRRDPIFLLLGIVAAAAVLLGAARDEKVKRQAYRKAILKEYPTVVKKISLYLASGMNLRNIWQAVYEEGIKKKGKDNPFYKEMGVALNEISSGISEGLAYTRFGERTKEPELIRFTALLSQNLKKGSSRLKELLNEEVTKAFMEKKQRAIKEGEEAGTKMLIPMMLLLIDVMIIIVIPAFRGM